MPPIPFFFYSVLGNTFALLDEITGPATSEGEKSAFARLACATNKGIGADNMLALQRADSSVLDGIRSQRKYPLLLPQVSIQDQVPFVFRMFEPDGGEALCCGNGLLAMAMHADCFHGLGEVSILTELPSGNPALRTIGRGGQPGYYRVNLGVPRPMPVAFLPPGFIQEQEGAFGLFKDFRVQDAHSVGSRRAGPVLSGYAVYTGEPHLVFLESAADTRDSGSVFSGLFDSPGGPSSCLSPSDQGARDNGLLDSLGLAFNAADSPLFPQGVNLVFARVADATGVLEYRCFERGLRKETLACGTGAAAAASLAHHLGLVDSDRIRVRSIRGAWSAPEKELALILTIGPGGSCTVSGPPKLLYRALSA